MRRALAAAGLVVIALLQLRFGVRQLLEGEILLPASQVLSAWGLAAAAWASLGGPARRDTLALGLGVNAFGVAFRVPLLAASGFGPFSGMTALQLVGAGLATWGAYGLARDAASTRAGLALRGGALILAVAYLGFLGLLAGSGDAAVLADFALRAGGALLFALLVEAPLLPLRGGQAAPA